jgi:hypothetical protein
MCIALSSNPSTLKRYCYQDKYGSKYNKITYIYELSVIVEAYYFMQLIYTNKNFLSIGQRNGTGCVAQ